MSQGRSGGIRGVVSESGEWWASQGSGGRVRVDLVKSG